jgi:P-type conjugative transfer protein TrbG
MKNNRKIHYKDTALHAIHESLKWQNGGAPRPLLKDNGVVRFPYGEYQPTITCKPLNLCDIELQAGEEIQGILIGDSIRWNDGDQSIPVVYSGQANKLTPHLVLKPSQTGLETTLMVTTSKRTYMIKLCSSSHGYLERAGFYYPEEAAQKSKIYNRAKNSIKESSSIDSVIQKNLARSNKLNRKYSINGKSYNWKPVEVFDDGISVFIKMPDGIDSRNLPGICILDQGNTTQCELVNFRYDNHFFIIDKLFDKAKLTNGFGSRAETVTIIRDGILKSGKHRGWSHLFGR